MTTIDKTKEYWKYAFDVVEGKIVTGKLVRLACERMIKWASRDDIYFDYDDVDKKIAFVQKIKHTEGRFAGEPFIMLPYQKWIYANTFGWKYTDEPDIRVVNNVFILTVRKTGKSFLGASFALVGAIADNENAPEIAFIANSAKQASILFKHCSQQCASIDPNNKIFKRMRHDIRIPVVNGSISILSSDTSKLDGRNDSIFIRDEGHEARTFELWNILKTGQGSRKNPLAISISTAGFNIGSSYPLYNQWEYCCQILNDVVEDDTWFPAIYQLDEEDDWKDENVWIKACPSLGVTVSMKYMRDQIRSAINTPSNEVSIKTKNLNMWCQSQNVWLPYEAVMKQMQAVDIYALRDEMAFGGVDLSAVSDLTATAICIPPNPDRVYEPDKFIFKVWLYVPEDAMSTSPNREYYADWIRRGECAKTSGNVVDYDYILKDQLEINSVLQVVQIGYDTYNATQYTINAESNGLPMSPYSQTLASFNKPTKFFEQLILSGKAVVDISTALAWQFQNVELKYDHYDNCKPVKSGGDKTRKIDGVIAMLEALGSYLESKYFAPEAWIID